MTINAAKEHEIGEPEQNQLQNQDSQPPPPQGRQQNYHNHQQHTSHHNYPHNRSGHFNKNHYQHHQYQNKMNFGNNSRGGDSETNANHVLLITVYNPQYPITCDIIHQLFNVYGKVSRIVIFKKNGVQAMVEYDNIGSARRAKSMLQGYEVYNGCCILRVEYAKPTRLNIYKNDQDSFDYTNPNLGAESIDPSNHEQQQHAGPQSTSGHSSSRQAYSSSQHATHPHHGLHSRSNDSNLNGAPPLSHNHHQQHYHAQHSTNQHHLLPITSSPPRVAQSQHGQGSSVYGPEQSSDSFHQQDSGIFNVSRASQTSYGNVDNFVSTNQNHHFPRQDGHHHRSGHGQGNYGSSNLGHQGPQLMVGADSMPRGYQQQGTVMMVYGLCSNRINCDKLFNLFCLYGNVARVCISRFFHRIIIYLISTNIQITDQIP